MAHYRILQQDHKLTSRPTAKRVVELGLEEIVAKRADSPYRAGRQPTWIKIKNQDYARREALRFR
jgi:ATP-dependent DNA ligase